MIKITPFEKLGHANHGWLDAHHHFSFADYYDPARMGFGHLRVWNDDTIKGDSGFPTHPHKDMEIITYVRTGAISHEDSLGNSGVTSAGEVQVMSAGTGIRHSEYNKGSETLTLFQIWIEPDRDGHAPRWDAAEVPQATGDSFRLLVSGRKKDEGRGALFINQDAAFYGAQLEQGANIEYVTDLGRMMYLVSARGEIAVNGSIVPERAGVQIEDEERITIDAPEGAEVVLLDLS
ncbi:MAG: pirin family protein [Rhodospirillaceae bacterium]|nr:pirin family protein [Rhodospirillaceae bacterium]